MNENFEEAAVRHWKDAKILDECKRCQNADYHYGFAAECSLKAALCNLGHFREEAHRTHINILWNKMQATAFHRRFPGLAQLLVVENPFGDWNVEQRYHGDGAVTCDHLRVHRDYARRLLIAIDLYRG